MTGLSNYVFTFPGFSKPIEILADCQEHAEKEALYATGMKELPEGTLISCESTEAHP